MLVILLAIIIANGFIILKFSPSQFYKLHRYDGQLLYIKTTFLGLLVTAGTFLVGSYFSIIGCVSDLLPNNGIVASFKAEHLHECFIFFIISILISAIYCLLEKARLVIRARWLFRGSKEKLSYRELAKILLMRNILNDSPLDKLLFLSYIQNTFLLITMADRKVYVGRVISLGEPNENQGPDQEIAIVPVFSGYRDKDSLHVKLTTSYAGNIKDNDTYNDTYLVLKQDNIVSACEFIEDLYGRLSENNLAT